MVAFSHTLFGLALHTICTYYTMILGPAPYDFLLRARRKKRTSPPHLYAVSALQKSGAPAPMVPGVWGTSAEFGRSWKGANVSKVMAGCRRSAYPEEEKPYMLPLPASAFEPAVWSVAKVANDYLVTDGRNKYSVPCNLIGERVDIRVAKTTVAMFHHGSRIASHRRL